MTALIDIPEASAALAWFNREDIRRLRYCLHECGHLCAYKALNIPAACVFFTDIGKPTESAAVMAEPGPDCDCRHEAFISQHGSPVAAAITLLAGAEAERRFFGVAVSGDTDAMTLGGLRISKEDFNAARAEAAALVAANADTIRAAADAMLAHRETAGGGVWWSEDFATVFADVNPSRYAIERRAAA